MDWVHGSELWHALTFAHVPELSHAGVHVSIRGHFGEDTHAPVDESHVNTEHGPALPVHLVLYTQVPLEHWVT